MSETYSKLKLRTNLRFSKSWLSVASYSWTRGLIDRGTVNLTTQGEFDEEGWNGRQRTYWNYLAWITCTEIYNFARDYQTLITTDKLFKNKRKIQFIEKYSIVVQ